MNSILVLLEAHFAVLAGGVPLHLFDRFHSPTVLKLQAQSAAALNILRQSHPIFMPSL